MRTLSETQVRSQPLSSGDIFRENLRVLVSQRFKSVRAFSLAIGVSGNAVKSWIEGPTLPEMGKLDLIAEKLAVAVPDLFVSPSNSESPSKQEPSEQLRSLYMRLQTAEEMLFDIRQEFATALGLSSTRRKIGEDSELARHLDATRPEPGKKRK